MHTVAMATPQCGITEKLRESEVGKERRKTDRCHWFGEWRPRIYYLIISLILPLA